MTEQNWVIALDVGGTSIKAGVVPLCPDGHPRLCLEVPSHAHADASYLIRHFASVIDNLAKEVLSNAGVVQGVVVGFPGPFDYERGIAQLRGLEKFESLNGLDLRAALMVSSTTVAQVGVVFENDAALFALGEVVSRQELENKRLLFLTLGTGLGSCFIVNGQIVRGAQGASPQGYLYDLPYRDGVVDDYISRRGILALASKAGALQSGDDVRDIAMRAKNGDPLARGVFRQLGLNLAEVLLPWKLSFCPDHLVLGGAISKSLNLFSEHLGIAAIASQAKDNTALLGAVSLFQSKRGKS